MRSTRLSLLAAPLFLLFTACPGGGTDTKKDPCESVTCGAGICVQNGTAAQCICNANYEAKGTSCVPVDACAANPCATSGKVCQSVNGTASCSCPSGFIDQGNGCVQRTACTANSCTAPHQTQCSVDPTTNTAKCSCDTGFLPSGGACVADPFQDCSKTHSGGPLDDQYEPNECPRDATPVTLETSQDFTLGPAGDEDWLLVSTTQGHIVQVDFSGATTGLYIDVFASDAVTPLASSHSGLSSPSLRFLAPNGDAMYVRVKALSASVTTSYSVYAHDLGPDDFANDAADALTVSPTTATSIPVTGDIQYDGDVDFIKVGVVAGHTYRITLSSSTATGIQVEVQNPDGTLRKTMDETLSANLTHFLWPSQSGAFILKAKAESPGLSGAFSLTIDDLGADDHADLAMDATAITPSTTAAAGTFERTADTDVFKFSVTSGHIYKFTCQPTSTTYYGCVIVLRDDAGTVLSQTSSSYPSTGGVTVEAQAAGVWTASVQNYSTSYTGAYTYKLEDLGADDYGDTPATASPLTVGTPVNGNIELSGDHDVFSLSTTAGHIYSVTCTSSAYDLCYMIVRDSSNTTVVSTSYGTSVTTGFRAPTGGTYTIDTYGYSTYTGSYQITVTDSGTDDHGDTAATATTISSASTSGNIQYNGDHDFFAFTATQSHIYTVGCTSSASYLCNLKVLDPNGVSVGTSSYGTSTTVNFLANTAGRYTIETYAYSSYTGTYAISVTDQGTDDHGDTAATATALTAGTAKAGNIQYAGDHDWFSIATTANHVYTVSCSTSATYLCYMIVRDPNGVSVASTSYGTSTTANFGAGAGGTYTIETYAYSTSYTGAYSITVTDAGVDDYPNSAAAATAITVGTAVNGNIQFTGDHDFMSFTATANRIYSVSCTSSAYYLCELNVRDSNGVSVGSSSYGSSTTVLFKAATGGTYTVDTYGYSSYTGTYSLTVTDAGADDHGDTAAAATSVTVGSTTNGNIQYGGDKDVFAFTAVANKIYKVGCTSTLTGLCVLSVKDSSGVVLGSSTYGTSTQVLFKATAAGTVTAEASSYSSSYTGAYQLSVTDMGADDHGDTPATATGITAGAAATAGNIQYGGDKDVFAFTAAANHIYHFTCTTSASDLCVLTVRDSAGTTVTTTSYSTSSTATFIATSAQVYSVETRGYSSSYTGTYSMQLFDDGVDDHGNTAATGTTITPGAGALNGNIQISGDKDDFVFTATAGRIYNFTCNTSASYICYLVARDPNGTTVASTSYGTSTTAVFKATLSGTYSVEVASYYSGYTGAYTVSLTETTDDYGDTYTTAGNLSVGVPLTGNLEISGDVDFFAVNLNANQTYSISVPPQGSPMQYFYIAIYSTNGTTAIGTTTYSSRSFTTTAAGTYYIKVYGYYSYVSPYTITIQ
ncbi:MAG: hypothetical protein ACJ790_00290 [Myxococcaceae bacterium]